MSIKFLFLYIIILSFVSSATAQTTLSSLTNAPRNGDNIEREVMAVQYVQFEMEHKTDKNAYRPDREEKPNAIEKLILEEYDKP